MHQIHEPETHRLDADISPMPAGIADRGELTIFLGAAPGVGKTYAMLTRARRLQQDGADIVIGLAQTHGRSETACLLEGLETLPARSVARQGVTIDEFDLDAALARHPRIVVVDELAHSNPPGSRHPKRYQDIEELLGAGIDVWTALNVQHLESLSEVVAQIAGATIRERVPDTVLARADEVLLVDIAPADLIERFKEGKVYLPLSARRAAENFFSVGTLTALREMALRRTADRVDDQVVDYLKQNAIDGRWATGERLLVCVGPDPLSQKVVRTASRLASALNAPWIVVSIERADQEAIDGGTVAPLEETFKLAEQSGAQTRRLIGNDFVKEILKLARREHATQIVIGARPDTSWRRLLRRSLPDALLSKADGIGIHLVTDDSEKTKKRPKGPFFAQLTITARQMGIAVGSVLAAVAIGRAITAVIDLPNVSLLLLMAVLVSAVYAGRIAAFSAALLSAVAYNFFFIDPLHTMSIAQPHAFFALAVFLAAATLSGSLASRIREQAKAARDRASAVQALYEFSRKLSGTIDAEEVLWAAVTQLQSSLKRDVVLLLPENGELKLSVAWPPDTSLDAPDIDAARWAMDKKEPAGNGTGTLPASPFQFRPLATPHGSLGVCGFRRHDEIPDNNQERALTAIIDQTAVAIDRARLSSESVDQAARLEGERFRTTLLSSISHDLRTPLATIARAVTSLRELGERMSAESRDDLLQSIEEESDRLTRFVANLLDMTRIESGSLNARRDRVDVADVVRAATERARKYFPGRVIETSIAGGLPPLRGDSVLLGQVLFNLLDNANKYGGEEPVTVYARCDAQDIVIAVTDLGKGIAPKELDKVFEKFYRRGKADGRAPGTGLSLSIARGFVEAMGGRIGAESPALRRKGTRITMRFPIPDHQEDK